MMHKSRFKMFIYLLFSEMSGKDSKDRKFYDLDTIDEPETRGSDDTDKTELSKYIKLKFHI